MTVRRLRLDVTGGKGATRLVVNSRRRRIEGISSCERALVGQGGIGFHSGIAVGNDLPELVTLCLSLTSRLPWLSTFPSPVKLALSTVSCWPAMSVPLVLVIARVLLVAVSCTIIIACADQTVRVVDRPAAGQGHLLFRSGNRTRGVIDAGR